MSASDDNKIISISNVNNNNNDDEDEEEEDENENDVASIHNKNQNQNHHRFTRFGAAKHQFAKFKTKFSRIKSSSKRSLLASSSSSSSSSPSSLSSQNAKSAVNSTRRGGGDNDDDDGDGDGNGRRRRSGCKFCCLKPQVMESLDGSPTISDPNNPNFTVSMLRVLIETNDFCSKDCNPHLDSFNSIHD